MLRGCRLLRRAGGNRGPDGLTVDLAGVAVRFSSEEPSWTAEAFRRYGAFAVPSGAPRPDVECRFRLLPGPGEGMVPSLLASSRSGERLSLSGESFDAWLDLATGESEVASPGGCGGTDVLLRNALPLLVRDGLVLHACALAGDDVGYVCCGSSGAGKSTLAGLLPDRALCDELAAVRLRGEAATVDSLPFWGGRRASLPLAAVLLLAHGHGAHELRRLAPSEAARALLPHVCWPDHWPERVASAFGLLASLCERVPVLELGFLPRPDIWGVIAGSGA